MDQNVEKLRKEWSKIKDVEIMGYLVSKIRRTMTEKLIFIGR